MNKVKYLHIMNNDKFIEPYINFINKNFNELEHLFIIIDGMEFKEKELKCYKNALRIKREKKDTLLIMKIIRMLKIWWTLLKKIKTVDKVYLHGLFDKRNILFLYIFRKYLRKSYWTIWGGDLYSYNSRKKSLIYKLWYKIEDYVKGNFYGYTTEVEGDYRLAKKWHNANGKYYKIFIYPSNLYKNIKYVNDDTKFLNIQVGNSADPSNNHLDILDKLIKYKDNNIKIYCILSYGDKNWKEKVISYGIQKFGDKFIPIVDFMKINEYMNFLSSIDIAIFAHNRQQAVGNITSLISMKKTVYLKERVTTWEHFKNMGIILMSFDKFNTLERLNDNILTKNNKLLKANYSEDKLKINLQSLFYE